MQVILCDICGQKADYEVGRIFSGAPSQLKPENDYCRSCLVSVLQTGSAAIPVPKA